MKKRKCFYYLLVTVTIESHATNKFLRVTF